MCWVDGKERLCNIGGQEREGLISDSAAVGGAIASSAGLAQRLPAGSAPGF